MTNAPPDHVFSIDGDRFVPTALAGGPWSPDAMHGGAPAALLARQLERHDPGPASLVVRLSVDLLRPVPLVPLEVVTHTVRPGRKVQWLDATLLADGVEVARASALRMRVDDSLDLPVPPEPGPQVAEPESLESFRIEPTRAFGFGFWRAVEVRQAAGSWTETGPATVWFRLLVPIVAGEVPSPLQRVAAAADFGNGVGSALPRGQFLFINADLTVHLHRHPAGEWVALEAASRAEAVGIGQAVSTLHDERGPIGRAVQSLLVDQLPKG